MSALLFDLDGTLVDTDQFHFAATQQALDRFGVTISQDYYAEHICGGKNEDIVRRLLPACSPAQQRDYIETKERMFRESLRRLEPVAGVVALLDWAAAAERQQPFGQLIKPNEVAAFVVFLLSADSGIITGSVIDYDQNVMGAYD